ncbi:MAG: hypothetical protein K2I25_00660, partial [Muribaculaceae bacterium]|nr:hypothetical protein [Muribaculaceae bacterium]
IEESILSLLKRKKSQKYLEINIEYVGIEHCSSHVLRLWHVPIFIERATRRAHAYMHITGIIPTRKNVGISV